MPGRYFEMPTTKYKKTRRYFCSIRTSTCRFCPVTLSIALPHGSVITVWFHDPMLEGLCSMRQQKIHKVSPY